MKKRKSSNFAVEATGDVEAGEIERERVAWRASATLPPRFTLFHLRTIQTLQRMKSRAAFEFTVRKMLRQNPKLYFWTFTLREVHSLKAAMQLWNQFLTLLKRNLRFRGVRVLELHEEHGCHFHVITNQGFESPCLQPRKLSELSRRRPATAGRRWTPLSDFLLGEGGL